MPNDLAEDLVCREFGLTVRAGTLDKERRSVDVVCSTDTIDAYGDSVEQKWDLGRFQKNPVLLFAHNSRALPIGRCENMRLAPGADGRDCLQCTIRFATEKANPMAEQVMQCFAEGVLRGVSVGFIPRDVRYEVRDGKEVCVLSSNELHELSVTPVPANHEALAKHIARAVPTPAPARATERDMTKEEIEALVNKSVESAVAASEAKHTAAMSAKDAEIGALKSSVAALEKSATESRAAADKATADGAVASAKALELEIDALVGKKIFPAEKDAFLELARTARPTFDKMIAARSDLGLFAKAIGAEPEAVERETASETKDVGDDLVSIINAAT